MLVGVVVPVALLVAVAAGLSAVAGPLAALGALIGLWFYEDAWIRAGQSVAMS